MSCINIASFGRLMFEHAVNPDVLISNIAISALISIKSFLISMLDMG